MNSISHGSSWSTSEVSLWKQLMLLDYLAEVFGDYRSQQFGHCRDEGYWSISFGNFVAGFAGLPQDNCDKFSPGIEVEPEFEYCSEYVS